MVDAVRPDGVTESGDAQAAVPDYALILAAKDAELAGFREQYKGVQRELEKARRKGEDQSAVYSRLDEIVERIGFLETASVDGYGDEAAKEKLAASQARRLQGQVLREQADEQAILVQEALEGSGLDWDTAPELAKARDLWGQGYQKGDIKPLKESVRETIRSMRQVRVKAPAATVPALNDAKTVKSTTRIDTSGSSAPNLETLTVETFIRLPVEERAARWAEFTKAHYGG